MTKPIDHEGIMATTFVTDPTGNLWATPIAGPVTNPELVALVENIPAKYAHVLSAAIGLYHMAYHAGALIEAHVAALEAAGLDEAAGAFLQMAANLQFSRRMATEGLASLAAKKQQ